MNFPDFSAYNNTIKTYYPGARITWEEGMKPAASASGRKVSCVEKRWFPWRVNRIVPGKPVFFPGCNLVNFLPQTARAAIRILATHEIGWVYDCCGKPLSIARDLNGAEAVLSRISRALEQGGATAVIAACPNCLSTLRKGLALPVQDIYTALNSLGVPWQGGVQPLTIFPPCPDRGRGELTASVGRWSGAAALPAAGLPCCGLGTAGTGSTPEALRRMRDFELTLTPCCASCTGQLQRLGVRLTPHALTMGLGVGETPAQGVMVGLNRLRPKVW